MKSCLYCKYAKWAKTASGRLHPSGDGRCMYPWKMPRLPQCMYWIGSEPYPPGGFITRKSDWKDHCVYFTKEPKS